MGLYDISIEDLRGLYIKACEENKALKQEIKRLKGPGVKGTEEEVYQWRSILCQWGFSTEGAIYWSRYVKPVEVNGYLQLHYEWLEDKHKAALQAKFPRGVFQEKSNRTWFFIKKD